MRTTGFHQLALQLLAAAIALAVCTPAWSAACQSNATGNWSANGTWTNCGGSNPQAGDTAEILNGHTVTLNANRTVDGVTIRSGGTLQISSNNTARTLTVTNGGAGFITIDSGGTFQARSGSNTTHTVILDGNLTNNGTLQFAPDNNSFINITFSGTSQTISGTPTLNNFNRITIDMAGADFNNIVDVTASVFTLDSGNVSSTEGLTFVDGTFRLSTGVTIAPFDNGPFNASPEDYFIPSNSRLWLNDASAVINYQTANNLTLSGGSRIRIDAGTFNFGNAADVRVRLYDGGEFIINGGAMNISGRFTCQTALPTGNSFTYTQTGGTLRVATVGNTSGSFPAFCNGTAGTFNMSGGTIIVERGTTAANGPSFASLASGSGSVTGGTVQIGDPAINPGGGNQNTVFVLSENPVWNLVVNRSDITARLDDFNLLARNSLSITSGTLDTLDNDGATVRNITVGDTSGNGGIGSWTNNGTFTARTSTVSFVGPGSGATLGGTAATTFNNLTVNKSSNHLTISSASLALAPTVSGTLTLTSGRIITPSCAIPITVGTAGTISGGSASSYVQTAVRKSYNAAAAISFLAGGLDEFPVGDASGNYTPVEISGGTTSAAGSLTVCVTPTEHPNVTTPIGTTGTIDATKSVNRYWTFTNSGLDVSAAPIDATFKFVAGDVDGGAATANFIVERWNATDSTWNPTTIGTRTATSTRASNIVLPVTTNEFAIGEPVSGFTQVPGAFNAFDTTTPAGAILGKIQTKVSNTGFTLAVVALNTNKNAVDTTWNQAGTAVLLDASDNSGALDANGCRSTWTTVIQTVAVPAAWASGRINVAFAAVPNSYKDVRVRFTDTPPPGTIGCSTDRFAIRPQSITASGHDATWETAGTARALNNTGATGGNVHKASTAAAATPRPFTLRATPVPGTASNYASATASVRGTPTVVSGFPACIAPPASCATGTLAFTGASWAGNGATLDNATAHYSEAGVFNLQFEDQTYANVDVVDGSSAALRTVPATGSAAIGRFVPASFDFASPSTPQFRTFGATCAGARSFTYIGQPFWYVPGALPTATVRALNAGGAVTTNYKGTLWKLAAAGIGETYSNNATGPSLDTALVGTPSITEIAGTGTGTYSASGSGTIAYTRSTAFPLAAANNPFTANISLAVTASDASENTGNGTITSTTQTFNGGGGGIAFDSGALMRYGIMRLQSAYGSDKVNLPVPLDVQFWNGTAFARNTADNCTALATGAPPPNITLSAHTPAGCAANLPNANLVLGGSGLFTAGVATLTVNKPTVAGACSALVTINLTSESKAWLKTRRTSATFVDDPAARVTFGVFGAQPRNLIFRRENY